MKDGERACSWGCEDVGSEHGDESGGAGGREPSVTLEGQWETAEALLRTGISVGEGSDGVAEEHDQL